MWGAAGIALAGPMWVAPGPGPRPPEAAQRGWARQLSAAVWSPRDVAGAGEWAGVGSASIDGLESEPDLRVRIRRAVAEVEVKPPTGWLVRFSTGAGYEGTSARAVRVSASAEGWRLGERRTPDTGGADGPLRFSAVRALATRPPDAAWNIGWPLVETLHAAPLEGSGAGPPLLIDGRPYAGRLWAVRSERGGGGVDVIEELGLEAYLAGVVAAEVYPSWPGATLEAQAIAARSYALSERARARRAGEAVDLDAGRDQAYAGEPASPEPAAATARTRGVVLMWEGQVVRAYYHSVSGGRSAAAGEVWGGALNAQAPLQAALQDELGAGAPYYRWTVTRGRDEVARRLRAWGRGAGHPIKDLGALDALTVQQRNGVGRPVRYSVLDGRLTGPGGLARRYTLTAEQLRIASNTRAPGVPDVRGKTMVRSGDMEWTFAGETVTIAGRGFGHGVGLCQWSAKELGERGTPARDILARYYPGAEVARAY